jgi:hypothetical protein
LISKVCVCVTLKVVSLKESRRVQSHSTLNEIGPSDRPLLSIPHPSRIATIAACPPLLLIQLRKFVIHQDTTASCCSSHSLTPLHPSTCSEQLLISRLFGSLSTSSPWFVAQIPKSTTPLASSTLQNKCDVGESSTRSVKL